MLLFGGIYVVEEGNRQPPTMPDCNYLARPRRVWRCCLQPALELHATRAKYQAKIWLQANKEHIDVPPPVATSVWKEADSLTAVWTRLPLSQMPAWNWTGDMRLQVKVQDCPMFLLEEEPVVDFSMLI